MKLKELNGASLQAGPVAGNKISSMAARGGTTSSAFTDGPSRDEEEERAAAEAAAAAAAAAAEAEAAAARPPSPPPAPPAPAPVVDLLNFDDLSVSGEGGSRTFLVSLCS